MVNSTIAFDSNGEAWIGAGSSSGWGGLVHFDGNTWEIYDPTNSNLWQGWQTRFATEDYSTFWSTRTGFGQTPFLYSFNVNSGDTASHLIVGGGNFMEVRDIGMDSQGTIWFITSDGSFKFDGSNWTHFHTSNSDIPANDLRTMLIDSNDNIWMGTFGVGTIFGDGLLKYDGNTFTQYTLQNSGLTSYSITALEEDIFGNLWIGHNGDGVTILQAATVSVDYNNTASPSQFELYNNYPNPFNPTTVISFSLPSSQSVNLTVYDVTGGKVATLMNGRVSAGRHEIQFDGKDLSSGMYFYQIRTSEFIQTRKMLLVK